jgi:hypothetical protein
VGMIISSCGIFGMLILLNFQEIVQIAPDLLLVSIGLAIMIGILCRGSLDYVRFICI